MALKLLAPAQIPWIVIGGPKQPGKEIDPTRLNRFLPFSDHPGTDLELARTRIQSEHLRGDGTTDNPYTLDLAAFPGVSPFGAVIRLWELLRPDHGLETIFFVAGHYFEVGALGVVHLESGWGTQLAEDEIPADADAARPRTFTGALAAAGDDPGVVPIERYSSRPRRAR